MSAYSRKKRSLLINPKFQWTLIGFAAAMAALVLIAVYALLIFAFHQFVQIGVQAGLPPEHIYFQFIHMQESTFSRIMLTLALIVGIILVSGGLVISHKIAGPIYRMQKEFNGMAAGDPVDLTPVHFRKGDYFPELADSFNALVTIWKSKKP
ncbi:MAG: hypothetical protein H7333_02525 [Bdellovibrionales bacterium]|nr:hypothetical protein [Oligoflexia bacterium]